MNKAGWRIARINIHKQLEFLDHDRDLFYLEGVFGYFDKEGALARAQTYKGTEKLFIVNPRGVAKKLRTVYRKKHNTTFDFLVAMEKDLRVAQDPQVKAELTDEFVSLLRQFITEHGLWCLDLPRTKKLFALLTMYHAMSPTALYEVLKYEAEKHI